MFTACRSLYLFISLRSPSRVGVCISLFPILSRPTSTPLFIWLLLRCPVAGWPGPGWERCSTEFYVLFKSSAIWCTVSPAFVEIMVVKYALVSISTSGIRSLKVFIDSQGVVSLLNTNGVELSGLLHDFSCLSVMFASIYLFYAFRFPIVAAVLLAMLAL